MLQGSFLAVVSSSEHLLGSAKIDIRTCEIVQRPVVALVVVIVHSTADLNFKLSGLKVILQVHNVVRGISQFTRNGANSPQKFSCLEKTVITLWGSDYELLAR